METFTTIDWLMAAFTYLFVGYGFTLLFKNVLGGSWLDGEFTLLDAVVINLLWVFVAAVLALVYIVAGLMWLFTDGLRALYGIDK